MKDAGQALTDVLSFMYGVPEYLIVGPLEARKQCVALTATPRKTYKPDEVRPILQPQLEALLHLTAHKEYRQTDIYVLKLPVDGTPLKLRKNDSENAHGERNYGSLTMPGFPISTFASELSVILRRPVINETGLDGRFDLTLTWAGANLVKSVKEQLGLDLVSDKRSIEWLVIDTFQKMPNAM